jgi:hypothetical protein
MLKIAKNLLQRLGPKCRVFFYVTCAAITQKGIVTLSYSYSYVKCRHHSSIKTWSFVINLKKYSFLFSLVAILFFLQWRHLTYRHIGSSYMSSIGAYLSDGQFL